MKKLSTISIAVAIAALSALFGFTQANHQTEYTYQQITTVESVVSGGLGRSRMISIKDNGEMAEEKMENFFSFTGINFGNIRFNDQMITDKVSTMNKSGWELVDVISGVYASDKKTGLFITRYLFRKAK